MFSPSGVSSQMGRGWEWLRRWLSLLRQPQRTARIARALWVALAVVVWNVVFDQIIVAAGRRYVMAATVALATGAPYVRMDDWMQPAVRQAVWMATIASLVALVVGLLLISLAQARDS